MVVPERRHHRQASLSYVYSASLPNCIRDLKGTLDQECTLDGEHTSWDGSQARNTSGHHSTGSVGACCRGDGFIPPRILFKTHGRGRKWKKTKTTQDVEPVSSEQRWLKIPPLGYVTEQRGPPRRSGAFYPSSTRTPPSNNSAWKQQIKFKHRTKAKERRENWAVPLD